MEFGVEGITCSNCTNSIERMIKKKFGERGLVSVACVLLTHKINATFNTEEVQPEEVAKVVNGIGFTCTFRSIKVKTDGKEEQAKTITLQFEIKKEKLLDADGLVKTVESIDGADNVSYNSK